MINEYAVEPESVANITDRHLQWRLIESFGIDKGRLVSEYPTGWRPFAIQNINLRGDIERKRAEELIIRLSEIMINRKGSQFSNNVPWLENARSEHIRNSFHAILAKNLVPDCKESLCFEELDPDDSLWKVSTGLCVQRTPEALAKAVGPMLCKSNLVVFIDPRWGPENKRHTRLLEAFLKSMMDRRKTINNLQVELHTRVILKEGIGVIPKRDFFEKECKQKLPHIIPNGLKITFRRWLQKSNGEKFHNRFIITDIGGVEFGIGLDDGPASETDNIRLLSKGEYDMRWNQFLGTSPAFDAPQDEPPLEIVGRKPLSWEG